MFERLSEKETFFGSMQNVGPWNSFKIFRGLQTLKIIISPAHPHPHR